MDTWPWGHVSPDFVLDGQSAFFLQKILELHQTFYMVIATSTLLDLSTNELSAVCDVHI